MEWRTRTTRKRSHGRAGEWRNGPISLSAIRGSSGSFAAGFTLAESLLATALLAIAVAGIASPIAAAYKQTSVGSELSQANSLARELMEEIATRPFVDPTDGSTTLGKDQGETTRGTFDNIDDFDGYKDTTSAMTGEDGTAIAWNGHGVYKRSVAVEYRTTPSGVAAPSGNFAMVTVMVTAPSAKQVALNRLFCRYPRGN